MRAFYRCALIFIVTCLSFFCCTATLTAAALTQLPQNLNPSTMSIGIVMYATKNISEYSDLSYEINSAYARLRNYSITMFDEHTSNFEPNDQRWNKVKIISNALNPENGIYRSYDYVVWLDSDLVIIDFDLKFEDIINKHPTSDLILSSELHAETGVANTGSFILRNCAWSRSFLRQWWESFNRSLAHDQIFFDRLYRSLLPDIRDHVTLLPPDALNSIPPAMLYQSQQSQVLHLMGEHSELRRRIFERGLKNMQAANGLNMPHQLGLTQPVLYHEAKQFFVEVIENNLNHMQLMDEQDADDFFRNVSEAREALIQFDLYLSHSAKSSPVIPNTQSDYMVLRHFRFRMFHEVIRISDRLKASPQVDKQRLVQSWHLCALLGNDLLPHIETVEEKIEQLHKITKYLAFLASNVHSSSLPYVKELQQRHLMSIGRIEFERGNYNNAANSLLDSIKLGKQLGSAENMIYRMDALLLLGSIHCFRGDVELTDGLTYLNSAIDIQKSLLYAEEHWKSDHLKLAEMLLRMSSCEAKSHRLKEAAVSLKEAQVIINGHYDRSSAEQLASVAQQLFLSIQTDLEGREIDVVDIKGEHFARKKMKKKRMHNK